MDIYNDAAGPITWYFCISKILIDYGEQALHYRGCDYYLTFCMTFFHSCDYIEHERYALCVPCKTVKQFEITFFFTVFRRSKFKPEVSFNLGKL
jgi:hypothetical protein